LQDIHSGLLKLDQGNPACVRAPNKLVSDKLTQLIAVSVCRDLSTD
jgi:hypothetical protein